MNCTVRRASFLCTVILGCAGISPAQQAAVRPQAAPPRLHAYAPGRETFLEGVFLRYEQAGAGRILLQTAVGTVSADLGPAAYLAANHFTLAAGDSVKLLGVSSTARQGTVFLARMIQKGEESLVLRTAQGAPLAISGAGRLTAREKHPESAR